MSQSKKKVVVTTKKKLSPTKSKSEFIAGITNSNEPLIYGKRQYMIVLAGVGLIFLGMLLMLGGNMPNEQVWDDNIIYSFRITVLAPVLILAGLAIQFYAIFKK